MQVYKNYLSEEKQLFRKRVCLQLHPNGHIGLGISETLFLMVVHRSVMFQQNRLSCFFVSNILEFFDSQLPCFEAGCCAGNYSITRSQSQLSRGFLRLSMKPIFFPTVFLSPLPFLFRCKSE